VYSSKTLPLTEGLHEVSFAKALKQNPLQFFTSFHYF